MVDEPQKQVPVQAEQVPPFPPANFPTLYADAVLNISPGLEVTKIYFLRFDPSLQGDNTAQAKPIFQIVMPTQAFLLTAINLEGVLKQMSAEGPFKETIVQLRKKNEELKEGTQNAAT